jgi:hypothetical protein
MLQLEHLNRIVDACYPESKEEAIELWHDIRPVKFGNRITWVEGLVQLADYQIPEDAAYMLILRVECYVTTFVAAAPGFGMFSPPPPNNAYWQYTDVSTTDPTYRLTNVVPLHILADVDEFLFATGGHEVSLLTTLLAPPDGNSRIINTLVYAYMVGALVAGRLGSDESTYSFSVN